LEFLDISTLMAGASAGLAGGTSVSAVRGDGGEANAISPDAIGPARFPSARLIEANRHHPRGILSGAALFIEPTECKSSS
jgi:hypothetical protein